MKKFVLLGTLVLLGAYLNVVALPDESHAGSFTAFGPKDYVRTSGKPTTVKENFSILDPNTHYTLHIYNGGKNNQFKGKISSAVISLNGAEVVRPNEFNQNVSHIEKPIRLSKDNALAVELRSKPDSGLTIEIIGLDNDPPTIVATSAPLPNAAGWNNTDVTVSFACSDTTSGIAFCPDPVLVQQDGANQVITGTATDIAGNTASTSVTINLDKTSPTIVATSAPLPNAAGWNNTDVTVSFACSDTTSGIAFCPGPVLVQQDGADQIITGTATDTAGNTASTSVIVNLDKTPPFVTILSPSSGATIEDTPVTVQGTVNEALSGVAAITCNGTPATLSGLSFTCDVSLVMGQNTIQTAAMDLAGNTGHASITVSYLGPKYLAIVDVMVTDWDNCGNVPSDYTGLAWGGTPTNPYIPGVIGTRVWANDVNVGIGGTYTTVWVKYDFVPVGSNRPVLVDYGVFHWPYWNAYCPEGWQRANGTSSGMQGALTTGTWGDCWRNGLCVHYMPMNQTDTFITNVGLSYTGGSEAACPALGEANGGYWPMQPDSLDIHRDCGDGNFVYLCYGRGKAWPPMPTSINVTDEEKLNYLATYAPRVWIAVNESYWPSAVEWAFPHLARFINGTNYWLRTREDLDKPSDVLDFFRGCNGYSTSNPCTISDVPVYAFWAKKSDQVGVEYVDLVYFFYYPYNRGKEVFNTIFGNHVGDWEHVTVRLMWAYSDQSGWSLQPAQMYLSAHDFGGIYDWETIPKINDTHPIVYSAWGSHGVWLTNENNGRHKYGEACHLWCEDLTDWTSEGTPWDTWNYLEAFDYNGMQGLGGSIWPLWMSNDFTNPGNCGDPSNPACGPIYRWGNPSCCSVFGYNRLEDGPTGPISKGVWSPGILK